MSSQRLLKIRDTRLDAHSYNNVNFVVKEGAAQVSYVPLAASSHSNNNSVFNLNNVGSYTARSSRIVAKYNVQLTLNCTNTDGANPHNVIQADNFGMKPWPLNNCINNINHQINQASYTLSTNEILSALTHYNLVPQDCNFYNNTQMDLVDSYQNATGTNITPLASYANTIGGDGVFKPRTTQFTATGNTLAPGATGNVVVNVELWEPLISPYNNVSKKDAQSLWAINGEIITLQYVTDLFSNMFAFWAPPNIVLNSTNVSLGAQAYLYLEYLIPTKELADRLPSSSVYHYNDYSVFSNNAGPCPAGGVLLDQPSQVVTFTNIPSKILVFARESNSNITAQSPNRFLKINRVSATWENQNPVFNNATPDQLYQVSVRNGLTTPRPVWKKEVLNRAEVLNGSPSLVGAGSVLCIDPSIDLGIRQGESTSSTGRYIFQITCDLANPSPDAFNNVVLYVVGISNGILERVGSEYRSYLLNVPRNVLEVAKDADYIPLQEYMDAKHANLFLSGGGIGDWFKKAVSAVKTAIPYVKKAWDPVIKPLGKKLLQTQKVKDLRKKYGVGGVALGGVPLGGAEEYDAYGDDGEGEGEEGGRVMYSNLFHNRAPPKMNLYFD